MVIVRKPEPLTVKEVIEALQQCPQDWNIQLEGCDCFGFMHGVELDPGLEEVDFLRDFK